MAIALLHFAIVHDKNYFISLFPQIIHSWLCRSRLWDNPSISYGSNNLHYLQNGSRKDGCIIQQEWLINGVCPYLFPFPFRRDKTPLCRRFVSQWMLHCLVSEIVSIRLHKESEYECNIVPSFYCLYLQLRLKETIF